MRQISLSITNFNRFDLLVKSYEQVKDDPRISEIIIVDDCSLPHFRDELDTLNDGKTKVHYNTHNLGVYKNKHRSVQLATNERVIVFDSDNILRPNYIDRIYEIEKWDDSTVYLPSFGRPEFDWRGLIGAYTKKNIAFNIRRPKIDTLINAMNYFVNREKYLSVFDPSVEPISADSIYINYLLLKSGCTLEVLEGLEYDHLIHNGSHYVQNRGESNNMYAKILNKLKTMI